MSSPRRDWLQVWHVNPSGNKDYDVIDGLRGMAIILVVCCHMIYNISPGVSRATQFVGMLVGAGGFGVVLFFALSGFLISGPFWRRKIKGAEEVVPPGYAGRRFWKIYPPVLFAVLALTPGYLLLTKDLTYLRPAAEWLVGLPLVKPVDGRFNPVMWSLIVEMQFYIVLPLLFLSLRRVPTRTCLWLIPLVFLVVPVSWRWWNFARGIHFSLHPAVDVHFPSLLDNFALGVFIAGLESFGFVRKGWAKLGDLGLVCLALSLLAVPCLGLFVGLDDQGRFEVVGWAVKLSSGFLLCYIADPTHPRSRLFSVPWLRWCGIISYEWYLFHQPMISWVRAFLGPAHGGIAKYALLVSITVLGSVGFAAVVYRFASLPLLRFGRGRNSATQVRPAVLVQ